MLHQMLRDLEWGITFVVITLILFIIIALLTIEPVIASITETDIAPGQVYCRSEQVLSDEAGHKWQVMFFTQPESDRVASLNLRLSGLSSSVYVQSQAPLIITVDGNRYEASDIFLEESPLPSIGQYDLNDVFSQISTADVVLEIPLENSNSVHLRIPKTVVEEWQSAAAKNLGSSRKIPSNLELMC